MNTTTPPLHERAQRLPRLSGWLLITVILLILVWAVAPQQLPVTLYKLSLVSLAAVAGYWLDRSLFPYARPDLFLDHNEDEGTPLPPIEQTTSCTDSLDIAYGFATASTPSQVLASLASTCMIRRAIIVGSAMLAMGLGA